MKRTILIIKQLDRKIEKFTNLAQISQPHKGWIKAIREALSMSMEQLGKKMGVSRQNICELEKREMQGSVSIKTMQEVANAMNLKFVFGFVPNDGSISNLLDRRANQIATEIVFRSSATMRLEDQENSKERIQEAIKERAELILQETPKLLWD